jgi:hypothetical protein
MEETCTRLDRQFEMILRERIDSARDELERAVVDVSKKIASGIQTASQGEQEAARAQLQQELSGVVESVLAGLNEKAAEISRHFGGELANHSRSHLEFVSGAISQLAKGIGKVSKD